VAVDYREENIMLYALWFGGASYNDYADDPTAGMRRSLETFPNIGEARAQLGTRYWSGRSRCVYADGRVDTGDTPAVDSTTHMLMWHNDPRHVEGSFDRPDFLLVIGPEGGVVRKPRPSTERADRETSAGMIEALMFYVGQRDNAARWRSGKDGCGAVAVFEDQKRGRIGGIMILDNRTYRVTRADGENAPVVRELETPSAVVRFLCGKSRG
jgi:hypothetical protein